MRGLERIPLLYDTGMRLLERTGFLAWRRWLAGGARGRILEVGVGTGRNLPCYAPRDAVVGLEPDLPLVRAARHRAGRIPLVVGRVEDLPFRDRAFDAVVSGLVFCSVADPERGLAEVRRVLTRAGELRMIEHVRSTRSVVGWMQDRVQPAWTWLTGGCHPNRETEHLVERAGFHIEAETRRARGNLRRFIARVR